MSFLAELTQGIVEGMRGNGSGDRERGRIERCCRELAWSVDERDGDKIALHFKDPLAGIRKVYISSGDEPLVLLAVYSYAILRADSVPQEVTSHLLSRSAEMSLGAWQATQDRDGDVLFAVRYVASGRGLTAALLKFACEGMVREVVDFDQRMSKAGLLQLR
jgi:hypothetical protein